MIEAMSKDEFIELAKAGYRIAIEQFDDKDVLDKNEMIDFGGRVFEVSNLDEAVKVYDKLSEDELKKYIMSMCVHIGIVDTILRMEECRMYARKDDSGKKLTPQEIAAERRKDIKDIRRSAIFVRAIIKHRMMFDKIKEELPEDCTCGECAHE
jgi:hypothetical protein